MRLFVDRFKEGNTSESSLKFESSCSFSHFIKLTVILWDIHYTIITQDDWDLKLEIDHLQAYETLMSLLLVVAVVAFWGPILLVAIQ